MCDLPPRCHWQSAQFAPAAARLGLEAIKQLLFHFFEASTAPLASPCTPVPLLEDNQEDDLPPGFFAKLVFVCLFYFVLGFVCFLL